MKKQTICISLTVLALIIVGSALGNNQSSVDETIKIGIIAPLTGNVGFLGENIVRSAELALEELGATNVELVVENVGDLTNQGKAASTLQKMIDVDGVEYVIDGMLSNGTLAAAPILAEAKVVMVTPLTGGENIDNASPYLFRNGPSDIIAGTKPAEQLYSFGHAQVALLTDNAEYTLDIVKHFRTTYEGEIVVDEVLVPDGTDYRTQLLKVKDSEADALFINTATGVSSRVLIKQAGELGIDIPIFANFLAYGPDLIESAGRFAEGVYIYDPEFNEGAAEVAEFMQTYEEKYGSASPIAFHTTGTYDAIKMGLEAIDEVGYDGPKIREYLLANIQNWEGYNGSVSFDSKGNTDTGFVLKQIQEGKLVLVE